MQTIANCKVVQSYIYLGATISKTGGCGDEVKQWCMIARSIVERHGRTVGSPRRQRPADEISGLSNLLLWSRIVIFEATGLLQN